MTKLNGLLGSLGFPFDFYRLRYRISICLSVSIYFRIMNLLLRGLKGNLSVVVAERYKLLH